jgi:hypothetical protein
MIKRIVTRDTYLSYEKLREQEPFKSIIYFCAPLGGDRFMNDSDRKLVFVCERQRRAPNLFAKYYAFG